MSLKPKEIQTLSSIQGYIDEHGYSPTMRELADILGLAAPSAAQDRCRRLVEKGLLTWDPPNARTVRVEASALALLPMPDPQREA